MEDYKKILKKMENLISVLDKTAGIDLYFLEGMWIGIQQGRINPSSSGAERLFILFLIMIQASHSEEH